LSSRDIAQNEKDVFAVEHRMFIIIKLKPKLMSKKVVIFNNQFSDSIVSEANLNAYEKAYTYKTD
jgi:hypothetical protein